jgi:hypothetical protein
VNRLLKLLKNTIWLYYRWYSTSKLSNWYFIDC